MRKLNVEEISQFHEYGLLLPTRTIYVGSESTESDGESGTDHEMAKRIIKNLMILDTQSNKGITIIMNNLGGVFEHGMAIYDAIKACRSFTTVKVYGQASSCGSIIMQAADRRVMMPNAVQLIHYGEINVSGHSKEAIKWVETEKRNNTWMEKMYLDQIKKKDPKFQMVDIQKMLSHSTCLTAKHSVELGLADKVFGE